MEFKRKMKNQILAIFLYNEIFLRKKYGMTYVLFEAP